VASYLQIENPNVLKHINNHQLISEIKLRFPQSNM